ncbi:MAG: MFS transporter [Chloroflexi bacterium]|nr:MFS transporter [Chloroflexota bacterium]
MAKVLSVNSASLSRAFSFSHGWQYTLGVLFIAQVLSAVGHSMMFPFLPLYIDSLGSAGGFSTELLAGLVLSAQGITMMIVAPVWGALADRFGRKKMIMRALFGGAITLALMGIVQNAEQLIFVRAAQGLLTGTVSANNALIAAAAPRHRVGFAMGTLQVGLWAGVAVGPLLGGVLADLFGYTLPFFITALLLLSGGLVVLLGVNEDFSAHQTQGKLRAAAIVRNWKSILQTSGVGCVLLIRFQSSLARTIIMPIAPLFVVSLIANDAATNNTYAGLIMAVSAATSTFGAVYLGHLGDRISHRKVLFYCAAAATALYVPQAFVADVWQLLFLQGLVGIAAGGLVAAPSALLSRYTRKDTAGAVYGMDNSAMAGSRAVAPLVGASIALMFGMRGTFIAAALVFAFIAITALYLLPSDKLESAKHRH